MCLKAQRATKDGSTVEPKAQLTLQFVTGGLIYKYTTLSGTWTAASGAPSTTWADIVCDNTGQYVVAIIKNASTRQYAWYSADFGATFTRGNNLLGTNLNLCTFHTLGKRRLYNINPPTAGFRIRNAVPLVNG